jgi:hypothetical protein
MLDRDIGDLVVDVAPTLSAEVGSNPVLDGQELEAGAGFDLSAHAVASAPAVFADAVEHVLDEIGSAYPFIGIVDLVGTRAAARFGVLCLVGLGRAAILTPGPLVNGSVVIGFGR